MNIKEFATHCAKQTGITATLSEKVINTFIDAVKGQLQAGNPVAIRNFGTFSIKERKEKVGQDIKNKKAVIIPPKKIIVS